MADGTFSCRIKQEIDTTTCSSSSPTVSASSRMNSGSYNNQRASPSASPDRQLCSSTTFLCNAGEGESKTSLREDLTRRLCLVCGDVASGFHYGVASCEACKAFFKRTIQGNIEYTCPANNECEINKRRRKACQACRFQKCLLMGMLKEGVRLDRVRGGRQKYRRNPVANSYQTAMYQPTISTLDDIKILNVLSANEPEPLAMGHVDVGFLHSYSNSGEDRKPCILNDKQIAADVHEMLSTLSDIYDKELVEVIGWAKQIPGFTDLPLNDQMKLLQASWTEILTLQLAYRSIPFNGNLNFASDFWLSEAAAKKCDVAELYYHCAQVAKRLERLAPRKEEYYLLKAVILANSDIHLDDYAALRAFREPILSSLNDCAFLFRHNTAVSHIQQLLLVLPSLRQADAIIRRFWTGVSAEGNITMNKLFVEMLEPVAR